MVLPTTAARTSWMGATLAFYDGTMETLLSYAGDPGVALSSWMSDTLALCYDTIGGAIVLCWICPYLLHE